MPFQTDDNRCAAPLVAIGEPLAGFRLEVIDVGQGRVDVYLHPDNGLPAVGPLNMSRDEFHNWLAQQTHTGGTDGYVPLPPEPELDEGDTPDDRSGDEPNATDPIDAPDGGDEGDEDHCGTHVTCGAYKRRAEQSERFSAGYMIDGCAAWHNSGHLSQGVRASGPVK